MMAQYGHPSPEVNPFVGLCTSEPLGRTNRQLAATEAVVAERQERTNRQFAATEAVVAERQERTNRQLAVTEAVVAW